MLFLKKILSYFCSSIFIIIIFYLSLYVVDFLDMFFFPLLFVVSAISKIFSFFRKQKCDFPQTNNKKPHKKLFFLSTSLLFLDK
jgi:hypothetical protein